MKLRLLIVLVLSIGTVIATGANTVIAAEQPPAVAPAPVRNTSFRAFNEMKIKAEAVVVLDVKSGQLLYTYHADWVWPMASITKLMSALVYTEQQPNWDATVALMAADEVGGGRLRVDEGAEVSKRDLLYCALVGSANNTATAMMRTSNLTPEQFKARMNSLAAEIGMEQARFVEPSGLELENKGTAVDVARMARYAFAQPVIQRATQTGKYSFLVRSTGEIKNIINTNKLLTSDPTVYVVGGKTGYLIESKNNFVVQLRPPSSYRYPKGEVIAVVFGSPTKEDSFAAAKALSLWAWNSHEWPQVRQTVQAPIRSQL